MNEQDENTGYSSKGQVLAFVSAKGGTGKTVLVASFAHLLMKSGKRFVTIDGDFSTSGLSHYLLGGFVKSREFTKENCLADSASNENAQKVCPLDVRRDDGLYRIILSSSQFRLGGAADERFLNWLAEGSSTSTMRTNEYISFLSELCDRLRNEFDYVILDTRGGYDFTTATAAAVADGYVIIVEADASSVDQVEGFKKRMDRFVQRKTSKNAEARKRLNGVLKGFIINKAIFSLDDSVFPEKLARLYGVETFGVIPADLDTIKAYQTRQIPTEKFPSSSFAYRSLIAFEQLMAPEVNWGPDELTHFNEHRHRIKTAWEARRRIDSVKSVIPYVHMFVLFIAVVFYFWYRTSNSSIALHGFFGTLTAYVMGSLVVPVFSGFTAVFSRQGTSSPPDSRTRFRNKIIQIFVASVVALTGGWLAGSTFVDLPKTLTKERDSLREQAAKNAESMSKQTEEIQTLTQKTVRLYSELEEAQKKLQSMEKLLKERASGSDQSSGDQSTNERTKASKD